MASTGLVFPTLGLPVMIMTLEASAARIAAC
jgi:hypothetical protein